MNIKWIRPFFLHLDVDRAAVQRQLPDGLRLDTGAADRTVVSLVAFLAEGPAPRPLLVGPLARLWRYAQLSVRTYVSGPQGPGLFFLDTRVSRFWPMVARAFGVPCRHDRELAYEADDHAVALRAGGVVVRGLPAPAAADPDRAQDGDRRDLLDRRVSYARLPGGPLYSVRMSHAPLRVRPVELDPDTHVELADLADVRLGGGTANVLAAQLADTLEATISRAVPAENGGRLRTLVTRAALGLVSEVP